MGIRKFMSLYEKFFNYLLSLGFISLLLIILSSLLLISSMVLSNDTSIGKHVIGTRTLLEDIHEVQEVSLGISNSSEGVSVDFESLVEAKKLGVGVDEVVNLNINENKSILTLVVPSEISNKDNIYYELLKNNSVLKKGDLIVYGDDKKLASFILMDEEKILVNDFDESEIFSVSLDEKIGKVFLVK